MSHAGLRNVTRCAEEFVKPVLCYRINVHEETAVADPPVEQELDLTLESSLPPISIAVGGIALSLWRWWLLGHSLCSPLASKKAFLVQHLQCPLSSFSPSRWCPIGFRAALCLPHLCGLGYLSHKGRVREGGGEAEQWDRNCSGLERLFKCTQKESHLCVHHSGPCSTATGRQWWRKCLCGGISCSELNFSYASSPAEQSGAWMLCTSEKWVIKMAHYALACVTCWAYSPPVHRDLTEAVSW